MVHIRNDIKTAFGTEVERMSLGFYQSRLEIRVTFEYNGTNDI